MPLRRSDYEQAARYLQYASDLLKRGDTYRSGIIRQVLAQAIQRLSPGDHYVGDAAAEITVLRDLASRVSLADARMEILKAVAVLRYGS